MNTLRSHILHSILNLIFVISIYIFFLNIISPKTYESIRFFFKLINYYDPLLSRVKYDMWYFTVVKYMKNTQLVYNGQELKRKYKLKQIFKEKTNTIWHKSLRVGGIFKSCFFSSFFSFFSTCV